MKLFPLLSLVALVMWASTGCQHGIHSGHRNAIKAALRAKQGAVGQSVFGITPVHLVEGGAPMTIESRFVGKCPYDGTLTVSESCMPTGSWTVHGTNVQHWTITYLCPTDRMMFNDYRLQILPDTVSVRLPIRD